MQNFQILCRIWSWTTDSWGCGPKTGVLGGVKISLFGEYHVYDGCELAADNWSNTTKEHYSKNLVVDKKECVDDTIIDDYDSETNVEEG